MIGAYASLKVDSACAGIFPGNMVPIVSMQPVTASLEGEGETLVYFLDPDRCTPAEIACLIEGIASAAHERTGLVITDAVRNEIREAIFDERGFPVRVSQTHGAWGYAERRETAT